MLTVEKVAIIWANRIWFLDRPARHHHLIHRIVEATGGRCLAGQDAQGFLLSDGSWADRERAYEVAEIAGQMLGEPHKAGMLFSEDVW